MLDLFPGFVNKVSASNQYLYLVDAKHRWTPSIFEKNEMAFGKIPCDFSIKRANQGGKFIAEVIILINMFGKMYEFVSTINEGTDKVERMQLKVSPM